MNPISPSGRPISEEARDYISPSPKLSADERIQIYNQQYWWRLLSILHQNFPTLTRLFGYTDFNLSIGMPFLTRYPSRHWSLSLLGNQLSQWIEEEYTAQDKPLIFHMAEVDWAYQTLIFCSTILLPSSFTRTILKKNDSTIHVKLFKLPFDLFSLRTALLKEDVEYWTESDFPALSKDKNYFYILYRTSK